MRPNLDWAINGRVEIRALGGPRTSGSGGVLFWGSALGAPHMKRFPFY